jgi:4-hydroxybenzoate polyprenyltransferase
MSVGATANRWIVYQRERFPVVAHGLLIAAFSAGAMGFSALLRVQTHLPPVVLLAAGFTTSFIFFLQLRIADEFKDFDDDARYRPYRPVPRGLVSLRELGVIGLAGIGVQIAIAIAVQPALLIILVVVLAYFALMTKEFFASAWLKAHPIIYLFSHMLIMPLIDFYITAFDWLVAGVGPPVGLAWFLLVSFLNGMIVEIGRKIRAPQDEEVGVETYTFLWGRTTAVIVWLAAIVCAAGVAARAAFEVQFLRIDAVVLGVLVIAALVVALRFLAAPQTKRAKLVETMSGAWTICMYLSLGIAPFLVRHA